MSEPRGEWATVVQQLQRAGVQPFDPTQPREVLARLAELVAQYKRLRATKGDVIVLQRQLAAMVRVVQAWLAQTGTQLPDEEALAQSAAAVQQIIAEEEVALLLQGMPEGTALQRISGGWRVSIVGAYDGGGAMWGQEAAYTTGATPLEALQRAQAHSQELYPLVDLWGTPTLVERPFPAPRRDADEGGSGSAPTEERDG